MTTASATSPTQAALERYTVAVYGLTVARRENNAHAIATWEQAVKNAIAAMPAVRS